MNESGPLGEAGARLRALAQAVVDEYQSDADDRYAIRLSLAIAKLAAGLSVPVVSGWQQRACEAIRKAIEDEDGLDGLEGEQLLREVGYYSKVAALVVTQEGE